MTTTEASAGADQETDPRGPSVGVDPSTVLDDLEEMDPKERAEFEKEMSKLREDMKELLRDMKDLREEHDDDDDDDD